MTEGVRRVTATWDAGELSPSVRRSDLCSADSGEWVWSPLSLPILPERPRDIYCRERYWQRPGYIYIYITHTYTHIYKHICVYMCMCACVYMRMYLYGWMCIWVYVCVCMNVYMCGSIVACTRRLSLSASTRYRTGEGQEQWVDSAETLARCIAD